MGLWIATDRFGRAFPGDWSWLAPLAGLLFSPLAVLVASAVQLQSNGTWSPVSALLLLASSAVDRLLDSAAGRVGTLKQEVRSRILAAQKPPAA